MTRSMVQLTHKKKSFKYIAIILIIILISGWYYVYKKSNTKSTTITITRKVEKGNVENVIQTTGTAEIINDQKLRFNQVGTVMKVYKKEWDTIKKNDLIAELDKTDVNNTIKQAQVSLDNSRIQLSQKLSPAQKDILKSTNDVTSARSNYETAKNDLEELRKQQENDVLSAQSSIAASKKTLASKELELTNSQNELNIVKTQQSKGITDTDVESNTTISNAYFTAKKYLNDGDNYLESIDEIFGITDENKALNDYYESYLSAKNTTLLYDVTSKFNTAELQLEKSKQIYNSLNSTALTGKDVLNLYASLWDTFETFLALGKSASDSVNASISGANYTDANISTQKSSMQSIVTSSQQSINSINSTATQITKISDPELIKQQSASTIAKQELQVKNLQDSIEKLKSDIRDAENNLELKMTQFENQLKEKELSLEILKNSVSISESNLEYLKSWGTAQDIALLKNNIEKQALALENAKKWVEKYELRAPFDGVINQIDFKNWDNIVADEQKYVYVQNPNLVRIATMLDQLDIAKTKLWQKVNITFDAYPKQKFEWVVTEINPAAVITSGVTSYQVRITLDRGETKKYIVVWRRCSN